MRLDLPRRSRFWRFWGRSYVYFRLLPEEELCGASGQDCVAVRDGLILHTPICFAIDRDTVMEAVPLPTWHILVDNDTSHVASCTIICATATQILRKTFWVLRVAKSFFLTDVRQNLNSSHCDVVEQTLGLWGGYSGSPSGAQSPTAR